MPCCRVQLRAAATASGNRQSSVGSKGAAASAGGGGDLLGGLEKQRQFEEMCGKSDALMTEFASHVAILRVVRADKGGGGL